MCILLVQFLDINFIDMNTSNIVKDEMFPTTHENALSFPGKLHLGDSFTSPLLTYKEHPTSTGPSIKDDYKYCKTRVSYDENKFFSYRMYPLLKFYYEIGCKAFQTSYFQSVRILKTDAIRGQ
jgi:hypothetical protein